MQVSWLPQFGQKAIEILAKTRLASGFQILEKITFRHRLFNGLMSLPIERELVVKSAFVAVLLYDPLKDQVVLLEQIRVGALAYDKGPWLLEPVAGMIDPGESPEQAAYRETLEESACILLDLIPIARYFLSPGASNEEAYLYCGRIDAPIEGGYFGLAAEGEDIKTHIFSLAECFALLREGKIVNATALIALMWLENNYQTVKAQWGS